MTNTWSMESSTKIHSIC